MAPAYERFNNFLSSIDMDKLRNKYKHIKIVELDMPENVQCLECAYDEYWNKRRKWPYFPEFYKTYKKSIHQELETWREACSFSEETFYIGLPARIYRTWASLLTQIQGAYVAESIYGKGNVMMGVDIDHSGKDIVINIGNDRWLPIQIKKETWRTDIPGSLSKQKKNEYIIVEYAVPTSGPKTSKGKDSKPFNDWKNEWGDRLERMDNGFIVFKPKMFEKNNLLKGQIKQFSLFKYIPKISRKIWLRG